MKLSVVLMLCSALAIVSADVYLHSPGGQNDRCDEKSNDRNNNKRLWDSENNSAGGYATIEQRNMYFYEGTTLPISYYSQHACGNGAMADTPDNQKAVDCQHVLQLGCEDTFAKFALNPAWSYTFTDGMSLGRPGADEFNTYDDESDFYNTFGSTCTNTAPTPEECTSENFDYSQCDNSCNTDLSNGGNRGTFNSGTCECCPRKVKTYGYHEPPEWWYMCESRQRNKGLFAADENVNNNGGATKTRQEPNSARYGFECTEERDYFPYWHPTPWIDLAVQTSDVAFCDSTIKPLSQNVLDKCFCLPEAFETSTWEQKVAAMEFNNQQNCEQRTNSENDDPLEFATKWDCETFSMVTAAGPVQLECQQAEDQMDNRLGSTTARGDSEAENKGDHLATYDWEIPFGFVDAGGDTDKQCRSCVIRLRYNISTSETLYTFDDTDDEKLEENPVYTYGEAYGEESTPTGTAPAIATNPNMPLRLAINTAQFGRTFEDRTYIFDVCKVPDELSGRRIHNVNVRGKRGNIAQVRNCVEYDFHPVQIDAAVGDMIHFQWAKSDYNNNGNAGEGRQGTDRTNVVAMMTNDYRGNKPNPLNSTETIFSTEDLAVLAWLNQEDSHCYTSQEMLGTKKNSGNDPKSCHFLNGVRAPANANGARLPTAYFDKVVEVIRSGTFNYMCSRNNNFTNRSQKAVINADVSSLSAGAIAGIAIGGIVGVVAIAGIGFVGFQKYGGTSRV